jgi:regulatory protein
LAADPAYVDGLKLLARRELSEAQVRQRLARRGHEAESIDAAVARLRAERALDDGRVAEAIARTAVAVKRRGRLRVAREIESAGISRAAAKRAVDAVYGDVDEEALLEAALAKRLRSATDVRDDKVRLRLYRYLVGQGFAADRVMAALDPRKRR